MLQAKYKSTFDHKGTDRHVYTVSGTPEELAQYKEREGAFYSEDSVTGQPLYYTNFRSAIDTVAIGFSEKSNKHFLDDREIKGAINKAKAIGGEIGQAMNNIIASALIPDSVKQLIAKGGGNTQLNMFPVEQLKVETPADSESADPFTKG